MAGRLRRALDQVGLVSTGFFTRVIATHAEADRRWFPDHPVRRA
jgi:hypothetical protein